MEAFFALNADLTFKWVIDKYNLSNADVSVKDDNVTVKCGSITVPSADCTVTKDTATDKVTVTATFKNVPKGTWVVGMHAFNRTSEDGKKVFSPWSNLKKATVR